MVEIKLLEIKDGKVTVECYPEGKKDEKFILDIDPIHKKILTSTRSRDTYVAHAAYRIYKHYEEDGKIPKITQSVWY